MTCPKCGATVAAQWTRCGVCGLQKTEAKPEVADMVRDYRDAVARLNAHKEAVFRPMGFVRVSCDRYHGFGFTMQSSEVPPDHVAVHLENGNTWWYPVGSVVPVTDLKSIPREVRRSKLRWRGYRLTGCVR